MKEGHLTYRTKPGRMAIKPECMPELVAWLAVWAVRARRGMRSLGQEEALAVPEMTVPHREHYVAMDRAIRWIITQAATTVSELELDILLTDACESLELAYTGPPPKGGRQLEVPSSVVSLSHPGRLGPLGEGGAQSHLPVGPTGDSGQPVGPDRGPVVDPDEQPDRRRRGRPADDRDRAGSGHPGGKKAGKLPVGRRKKRPAADG